MYCTYCSVLGDVRSALFQPPEWLSNLAQTAPGSMWEGGLRVHVELQANSSSSASHPAPKSRRWLPLVHAPANGAAPAAVVRLPPKLAHLPKRWAVGERVEVLRSHSASDDHTSLEGRSIYS